MNGSERTDPLTYRCHLRANTLVIQHEKKMAIVYGVESSWSIVARLLQKSGDLGVRGWLTDTCESAIACPCAYECPLGHVLLRCQSAFLRCEN